MPKVFTEWTVLPHRPIEKLSDNLWRVSGKMGNVRRQMVLAKLRDGRVVVDNAIALDALTTVAVVLFLLVAGMEVDLSRVLKQGKVAIVVSVTGMAFPFAVGFVAGWLLPETLGREPGADPTIFALFFATALAISALPVIAKTLMDLNIYRSDIGITIVSAAAAISARFT